MLASTVSATAGAGSSAAGSILAEGRWIKIHVDSSSVYRLDYGTLRGWGFPDPEKVTVYGYGSVEQAHALDTAPDALPQIPATHIGDAIYFYGEGDRRIVMDKPQSADYIDNYYSTGSNYFLTDSRQDGGPGITRTDHPASGLIEDTHTHIDLRTPREYNVHEASVFFYSKNIANAADGLDCRFDATDFAGDGYVSYRYIFHHSEDGLQYLNMEFTGDVTPGEYTLGGVRANDVDNLLYSRSVLKTIPVTPVSDKSFGMHFSQQAGCRFKLLSLAEIQFAYSRKNILRDASMHLRFASGQETHTVRILDPADNLTVWDVSSPRAVTSPAISRDADGNAIVTAKAATPESPVTLCAFVPGDGIPAPALVGEVRCRNLHAIPSADYLIVTTGDLLPEAERLAAIHREMQGLKVEVVTQDEVFNEFSSGSRHPNGLRKFVRMLGQRKDNPLRYLLLFGASTYDPRKLSIDDGIEYLIGYETERVDQARYSSRDHATDLYFGMTADRLSDNLGLNNEPIRIGIARAPVIGAAEARVFVDKSLTYLSNPEAGGRFDTVVLSCCSGNKSAHFDASETLRDEIARLSPSTTCSRVYAPLYPKQKSGGLHMLPPYTVQAARRPILINYTGHSGKSTLGDMLSSSTEKDLRYGSMPIMYIAGCISTTVDNISRGIGAQLFLRSDGPIAVIGSGRDVYMTNNHTLNEEFVRQLFSSEKSGRRLGDIWRDAINGASATSTQRVNNFCYNFLADPALPVRMPDRTVIAESIDGEPWADGMTLPSLSPVTIKGTVNLPDGSVDTSFDGTLYLTLFDAPKTARLYVHEYDDRSGELTLDESPILERAVDVRSGQWTISVTPPAPAHTGLHRLTFLAYADTGDIAIGNCGKISFTDAGATETTDTDAPEIGLHIDSESMTDGDATTPWPTLLATVSDSGSGLDTNASSVGGSIRLMLDGTISLSADAARLIRLENDGSATLSYPLPKLTDGHHYVSLTARDVAGNSATRTINFTVTSKAIEASLQADTTLARECITFSLNHNRPLSPEATLIIRDMSGNTVRSIGAASFPYAFDLRDSEGKPLPDGRYRASAILKSFPRFGSTPELEFTIAKPSL